MRSSNEPADVRNAFFRRGLESLEKARASGRYFSSESVLRELRSDLESIRNRRLLSGEKKP
jgi:hypothetical protein